jgi:hypothetical protein
MHAVPLGQLFPQLPQLSGSPEASRQTPLHKICPWIGQTDVQLPPWQIWPLGQVTPQPPQFCGSLCESRQYRRRPP